VIIVEVLGYGGNGGADDAEEERRNRTNGQSQDPSNRVQILDAGELTATERKQLIEEKRRFVGRQ
jgi:hypothetical protein